MKFLKIIFLSALFLGIFFVPELGATELFPTTAIAQGPPPSPPIVPLAPFPGGRTISTSGGAIDILRQYVSQIFKFGLAFISVFATIMIAYGGYEYMFAGGESGAVDTAKSRIMQALLGLVLLFCAALLLNFVNPNFFKL